MRTIRQALLATLLALLMTGLIWLCIATNPHSVTLNWQESPSASNAREWAAACTVAGFRVGSTRGLPPGSLDHPTKNDW